MTLLTWLYCPASNEERMTKAVKTGADGVIYDLEDAVAAIDKVAAREQLARHLDSLEHGDTLLPHIQVRVNDVESPWFDNDIAMVSQHARVDSIRLPKVEKVEGLDEIEHRLRPGMKIHALLETAKGVENMLSICRSAAISGVSLGEGDLRAQLRLTGGEVLNQIRIRLVIAAAAAGTPPPMGAAYLNVRDHDGLVDDTRRLANLGFVGRTAVHPRQLSLIRTAFKPTESAYLDARRILDSAQGNTGASALPDGTFIDRPVLDRAKQIAELWERA